MRFDLRDALILSGVLLFAYGLWLVYYPISVLFGGACLVFVGAHAGKEGDPK